MAAGDPAMAHDQMISRRLGTYELVRGCGFVVVVLTACNALLVDDDDQTDRHTDQSFFSARLFPASAFVE